MNSKDSELFREFVGDVEPLKSDRVPPRSTPVEKTPGMLRRRQAAEAGSPRSGNYLASPEYIARVKPWDELSFKRDGVQHGVFKNLRLGKYPVDVRLDLHRMSVAKARVAVFDFVRECVAQDLRCGLITHGRGENRENPALLKSCVNHWLRQMDEVLAFHSAQRHHGGSGSTYLLLRKSDRKREENREIYAKRQ